jgi:hypothetical protein
MLGVPQKQALSEEFQDQIKSEKKKSTERKREKIEKKKGKAEDSPQWDGKTIKALQNPTRELANLLVSSFSLQVRGKDLYPFIMHNLKENNPMEYHSCCVVFTTRKSTGKKDHPEEKTQFATDVFEREEVVDLDSFNRFIVREVKRFPLYQQFMPGLNLHHDPSREREDSHLTILK